MDSVYAVANRLVTKIIALITVTRLVNFVVYSATPVTRSKVMLRSQKDVRLLQSICVSLVDWTRRLVRWIDYPGIQYLIMLSLDNDCIAVAFQEYIQPGIHEPRERSNCFSLLSNEKHKQPFIPKREDKAKNLRAELLVLFC